MDSYADVGCVLKLNVHCEACKMKLYEVLSSISGVYDVTIDAEESLAKISGQVDPNVLLRALARNGKHAELKWVKFQSPAPRRGYYNDGYGLPHGSTSNGYDHNYYGLMDHPYRAQRPLLPEGIHYDPYHSYTPPRRPVRDHSYYNSNHGYYGY